MIGLRKVLRAPVLAFAVLPAAAMAQPLATGEVMARELFFEERRADGVAEWEADAEIGRFPAIFRALRVEAQRDLLAPREDCDGNCVRRGKLEFVFAGSRLLSLFSATWKGAYEQTEYVVADRIYDLRTGTRIRFADLFISWESARALIQAKICREMREMPDHMGEECPDADRVAYGLFGGPESRIGSLEVRLTGYWMQPGNHWDSLSVPIDRPLFDLIKPEYHADFRAR